MTSAEGASRGLSSPQLQYESSAALASADDGGAAGVGDRRRGRQRRRRPERARVPAPGAVEDVDMAGKPAAEAHPFSDDEAGGDDEDSPSSSESSDEASAPGPAAGGEGGRRQRRPPRRPNARLLAVHPEDDLLSACAKLRQFGAHDLPVLDPEQNAVVAMLSHRAIMAHLLRRFTDPRRLFDQPLDALCIGSFSSIVVVPATASVTAVLGVMAEHSISSVPIVGPDGAVIDVYSRCVEWLLTFQRFC